MRAGLFLDVCAEMQDALHALGDDLLASYLYGSLLRPDMCGAADVSLWLLVRPETQMQRVREAFLPVWQAHSRVLKRGPAVATPDDLRRFGLLFPDLVRNLHAEAQLLTGQDLLHQLPNLPADDPLRTAAHLAAELLRCSRLLAPASLTDRQRADLEQRLRWLAHCQAKLGDPPTLEAGQHAPASELLEVLHAQLATTSQAHPGFIWQGSPPAEQPPAHLPGLLALVGWENQLIVVVPRVDRHLIAETDWGAVAGLVSDEFSGLVLATPWQLRLAASVDMAVDLYLGAFEPVWGVDVLSGCRPEEWYVQGSAAALPVSMLVENLPADYCTVAEDDLGMLIHDAQNVLLNIQLRNELMSRRRRVPSQRPPDPLPGREASLHQRVAANFQHFRWWSELLTAGLEQL